MKRDFLFLSCEDGHDWKSIGGANAGCADWCTCSVPVYECTRCGDCDYGDNEEAKDIRFECAELRRVDINDSVTGESYGGLSSTGEK